MKKRLQETEMPRIPYKREHVCHEELLRIIGIQRKLILTIRTRH